MWWQAAKRARLAGIPFSITLDDVVIPDRCPVLGLPLVRSRKHLSDTSPSLDRIIPSLGYVPGNVLVVSYRVNRMKQNATPEEILQIGRFYQLMQDGKERTS